MLWMMLLACAGGGKPGETGETAEVPAVPTWYADVAPVVAENCARCHTEGGIATSFDDPLVAQGLATTMASYVASGQMPPPAPDPTCRDYEDSDRFVLSDEEKRTLLDWAEGGAPLGDPADAVELGDNDLYSLAPYDAELIPAVAYQPVYGADGNDYRCFQVDLGASETRYVTGFQAIVDNPRIVHHVVLFYSDDPIVTDDGSDPHLGFACSGLGEAGWGTIGAWGPGANPTVLPEGVGIPVPPDRALIVQMHYYDSFDGADQEWDQSGYGLLLADEVERTAENYPLGPTGFTIPAGEAEHTVTERYNWSGDGEILAIWPHMHVLGTRFEELVRRDGGEEDCGLRMNAWDFHDQATANLIEPIPLSRGDKLLVSCTWDNSADNPNQLYDPPQDVDFGEETNQEMCFGFTLVASP